MNSSEGEDKHKSNNYEGYIQLNKKYLLLFCVYNYFVYMYICTKCVLNAQGGHNRVLDPLEWKSQIVRNMWVLGIKPSSSAIIVIAPNYWAIFPAQEKWRSHWKLQKETHHISLFCLFFCFLVMLFSSLIFICTNLPISKVFTCKTILLQKTPILES